MSKLLLFLPTLLLGAPTPVPPDCPGSITGDPFPNVSAITPWFGPSDSGSTLIYSRTGLVRTQEIPMGLTMLDNDTLVAICDTLCHLENVPGVWSANWSRSCPTGNAGAFVRTNGTSAASMVDATFVVYQPPRALVAGETRVIEVKADLIDTCSETSVVDSGADVTFEVIVTRRMDNLYDVSASLKTINLPLAQPPECLVPGPTTCQELYGFNQYLPPTLVAANATVPLGEPRMLQSIAEDLDRYAGECGNETRNTFAFGEYCDRLQYDWIVTGGTGAGDFLAEGRSAIFQGTAVGTVTVDLVVTGTDGETALANLTILVQ